MLSVDVKKTLNLQKIQDFIRKANDNVMVGFLAGREHVPTLHRNQDGESPLSTPPIDTAELARELHYGTATIPARPFLEEGIESQKDKLKAEIEKQIKSAQEGKNPNWDKVGTMAVGAVQEFVRSDYYKSTVPNSQRTIDYKGSDTPLIDGGDLINSMTYVVGGR